MQKDVLVYFQDESGSDLPVGSLHVQSLRGKESFSFQASDEWLRRSLFRFLDPDLGQFSGPQYLRDDKPNFGLFMDSSPDRWGRMLMRRRESLWARQEGRPARNLGESDFLLGVFDGNRMGALRFKAAWDGPFLDNHADLAAPPLARLRQLEQASLHLEQSDSEDDKDYAKWLRMLVAPGSSLGGARPKANVIDPTGQLWIAKFPSMNDSVDQGSWETLSTELARRGGIHVADFRPERFGKCGRTFLTRRFDRDGSRRIHFASAMTLLGRRDGADSAEGASYLELAELITRICSTAEQDLRELWRRILFSIAISNTDDHLRNHGFLLGAKGWQLSPAFDLNPNPDGTGLTLNISEHDNALDFELALSVARYFRISPQEAKKLRDETTTVVSGWREIATSLGIARKEQELMAPAFRVESR